jgi:hypothetical protein
VAGIPLGRARAQALIGDLAFVPLTIPAEDPVHDISPAFPLSTAQRRSAILQPPKPEIPPSSWVLARAAERDLEAAD